MYKINLHNAFIISTKIKVEKYLVDTVCKFYKPSHYSDNTIHGFIVYSS